MDIADSVQSITGPLWSPLLRAPGAAEKGGRWKDRDGVTRRDGGKKKKKKKRKRKEWEQKRAYKGEREEGLTRERDDAEEGGAECKNERRR